MIYNIKGKNLTLGDRTKEKVEDKLSRVNKLFPEDAQATVKISSEKLDYTVEVTIPLARRLVRAESTQQDMMAAVDKAVDIIESQIVRHKGRMRNKVRQNAAFKAEYESIPIREEDLAQEEDGIVIEKSKRFELRPMDAEEAVMQMELLGHGFFVFLDASSDTINVVYKRKNGTYGIIEPEK
ncbi:ribosome-associated translation inhibitor RaiA [Anaerotignum faecicola]|nr:ribosome-associated translation inhibitor RaiA [Anaerotignum faecicola]